MADLLGSILSSMEKPPSLGDQESRRKAREQAARLKKLQEQEKQQKVEFRKRMEKEVSDFIQDSRQIKKKFQPMNKIERSILHDVVEVAGLTSFSFGEDDECRYVMIFKKVKGPSSALPCLVFGLCPPPPSGGEAWGACGPLTPAFPCPQEFAPSDEELESYRRGEEWDPQKAEEKRKLKELAQRQEEEAAQQGPVVVSPASDYKDKYSHLIGKGAAKDAAHMLQANKTYGCVPVANKRDTRSIEEAMNEIRAKKRLRQSGEELPPTS
ncbi:sperm-associated antigen 7 isoform X1 [Leopardus geoffroyi]|uniref:sperm-associated antigen 7 isoform X1 n=1 Tax=Leopardus geoffroyi TaxID=46844 RepID=UPI001E2665C3|nr:sperm-associated antigen 7 isoform X1 [Leopardus geoffroyi]